MTSPPSRAASSPGTAAPATASPATASAPQITLPPASRRPATLRPSRHWPDGQDPTRACTNPGSAFPGRSAQLTGFVAGTGTSNGSTSAQHDHAAPSAPGSSSRHMITEDYRARGLRPRSEIPDQPAGNGRKLTIEWTTGL